MNTRLPGLLRLATDLSLEHELAAAHRRIAKLERLVERKDEQIALLTARRVEFDLSADVSCFLRRQAG